MKLSFFTPTDPNVSVFFNVSQSVGRNGQNSNREDILLVQFLLRKIAATINPPPTQAGRDRLKRVQQVPLSGNMDQTTIDGITALQENMKVKMPATVVDGRISVAKGYLYGGGYWSIVALNAYVRKHNDKIWPRLQDFSDCPGLLKAKIKQML